MTTGEGSTVILQGIKTQSQDNGSVFVFRYLVYLLETFDESNRPEAQLLVLSIGLCLHESFADSLRESNDQVTRRDRAHLLRIAIDKLHSKDIPRKNAITDRLSLSSILEDLLQTNCGTNVVRSSFDLFDKAIQELIFECHVEPVARRENVSQLWSQIRDTDRTKVKAQRDDNCKLKGT